MNNIMQLDDKFDNALHSNEYTLADVYRERMRTARDKAFDEIQDEFKVGAHPCTYPLFFTSTPPLIISLLRVGSPPAVPGT
jgi:hypothetical protein